MASGVDPRSSKIIQMIDIIEPFDPHGPILTLSCEKMILGKILKDFSKILKTPAGRGSTG